LNLPEVTIRLAPRPADKDGNGAEMQDIQRQNDNGPFREKPSDGGNNA
jgi:hypothetical protein